MQPAEGIEAYCAAKAGVAMLDAVAAMELGRRRIRVNAIAPGLVETPMSAGFWAIPGVVEEFVENTTVGRFAVARRRRRVALFLASDESSFVSGSLYAVDGGAANEALPRPARCVRPLRRSVTDLTHSGSEARIRWRRSAAPCRAHSALSSAASRRRRRVRWRRSAAPGHGMRHCRHGAASEVERSE